MSNYLRGLATWLVFFLIAAGLGYPALNRYDPRAAVPDASLYARIASNGPSAVETHLRFRVLVPYLARGVFMYANHHTGSWDPLVFSFLLVNACFVATSAYLLFRMGLAISRQVPIALLASALYLLNFSVANLHLACLVDAAEACFLLALVVSLYYERWMLLPIWGVLGVLAKESFAPFSIVMAFAWIAGSTHQKKNCRAFIWLIAMAVFELLTLIVLQSAISGRLVLPWSFVSGMKSPTNYGANFMHSLADRNSWYILLWLLPLGFAGISRIPREWKAAAVAGGFTAIVLNAYHSTVGGGGGGLGRYVFNIAGPLLSLAAAWFLATWYAGDLRANGTARSESP